MNPIATQETAALSARLWDFTAGRRFFCVPGRPPKAARLGHKRDWKGHKRNSQHLTAVSITGAKGLKPGRKSLVLIIPTQPAMWGLSWSQLACSKPIWLFSSQVTSLQGGLRFGIWFPQFPLFAKPCVSSSHLLRSFYTAYQRLARRRQDQFRLQTPGPLPGSLVWGAA